MIEHIRVFSQYLNEEFAFIVWTIYFIDLSMESQAVCQSQEAPGPSHYYRIQLELFLQHILHIQGPVAGLLDGCFHLRNRHFGRRDPQYRIHARTGFLLTGSLHRFGCRWLLLRHSK